MTFPSSIRFVPLLPRNLQHLRIRRPTVPISEDVDAYDGPGHISSLPPSPLSPSTPSSSSPFLIRALPPGQQSPATAAAGPSARRLRTLPPLRGHRDGQQHDQLQYSIFSQPSAHALGLKYNRRRLVDGGISVTHISGLCLYCHRRPGGSVIISSPVHRLQLPPALGCRGPEPLLTGTSTTTPCPPATRLSTLATFSCCCHHNTQRIRDRRPSWAPYPAR